MVLLIPIWSQWKTNLAFNEGSYLKARVCVCICFQVIIKLNVDLYNLDAAITWEAFFSYSAWLIPHPD